MTTIYGHSANGSYAGAHGFYANNSFGQSDIYDNPMNPSEEQLNPDAVGQDSGYNLPALLQAGAGIVTAAQDPYKRVAVLEAQLQNAITRGASVAHINVLTAQLKAARAAVARSQQAAQSTEEAKALAKVGAAAGISLVVILTALLVASGWRG